METLQTVNAPMASLPRLAQEAELQKMLADEKMRSEQHRTNYQLVKAEYQKLQDEYVHVENELRSTIEEAKLAQEKHNNIVGQFRKDLASKQSECDELRSQILNPEKLDLLRIRVQEDVEKPFREKFLRLDEETDKYRTELNKLKYEYSFLKAEYEHEKAENVRIVEEMKMRHEAEVVNLRKDRETILTRSQGDEGDAQKMRTLQRDNAQLHLKLKGVLSELEETRAQREHVGLQSENLSRLQAKQLAEHTATNKALETERNTLKLQLESATKELANTQDLQTQLTSRIHQLEKDNIMLKNKTEEVSHKSKVEQTNVRMQMLQERGELERKRDQLHNQVEDLKARIDVLQTSMTRQDQCLADKERELARRVQAAREEEWTKLHAVEADRAELETRVQELERRRIDDESRLQSEREKLDDRLAQARDAKDSAEKEALVLKTKVSHQESLLAQVERERQENSDLKQRLHRIETTYASYVSCENELGEANSRLRNEVDVLKEEMRDAREEIARGRNERDKAVAQRDAAHAEERVSLQLKLEETHHQFVELQTKLTAILETNKKKKRKISLIISKMKNKVQYLNAKLEEACIERDALRKNVSPEEHVVLKRKLNDLMRRHREFRNIIFSESPTGESFVERRKALKEAGLADELSTGDVKDTSSGELRFGSMDLPMQPEFYDLATQHEKELAGIKDRLDQLDEFQRAQFKELKGVSPVVSPVKAAGARSKSKTYDSGSDGQELWSDDEAALDTEPVKCSS